MASDFFKMEINGEDFSDCIAMDGGYKWQIYSESAESATGITLEGTYHNPILWERSTLTIKCVPVIPKSRFRQLGKALNFGKTGERKFPLTYEDPILGDITQEFYCVSMQGEKVALPEPGYEESIRDGSFSIIAKKSINK